MKLGMRLVASAALLAALSLAAKLPHKAKTAKDFFVDGKHIPGVPFAVSDSYAGLLPITASKTEDREFFFWWYPAEGKVGKDDLVIWLNGGPGCSSLEGLLQENGPFLFPFNSTDVIKNPYSWTKLSNVLYVEQPVSTGLGKGAPSVHNEREVGSQFYGFLVEFMKTFPELKNKKLYITGESYAGRYVPYIADEIFTRHSKAENARNGLNYQGIAINDPTFDKDLMSEQLPIVEYAVMNQETLMLNSSFIKKIQRYAQINGVDNYVKKNLVYPPKGPLTLPKQFNPDKYDAFDMVVEAATEANPCFNIYNIDPIYRCPSVTDPLGFPPDKFDPSATNIVNNITGFKEYIHADPKKVWYECSTTPVSLGTRRGDNVHTLILRLAQVFVNGKDKSLSPQEVGIMTRLIDNSPSGRTVIQNGVLDVIIMALGSALSIQNLTFGDSRGFHHKPTRELIVGGEKKGLVQTERGLTFLQATGSGHMIPQDQPATAYKMQQYLLGQVSEADLYK